MVFTGNGQANWTSKTAKKIQERQPLTSAYRGQSQGDYTDGDGKGDHDLPEADRGQNRMSLLSPNISRGHYRLIR